MRNLDSRPNPNNLNNLNNYVSARTSKELGAGQLIATRAMHILAQSTFVQTPL
jgi:hypothetical protein